MSGMNFSGLVLAPNISIFGKAIKVTPKKSLPGAAPYERKGIWTVEVITIPMDDGTVFSNRTLKLGIRLADFPAPLLQGDWVSIKARELPMDYWQSTFDPNAVFDFEVADTGADGEGGSTLTMKRVTPS